MTDPIRMAVLGCGTIVKSQHLPAIMVHPHIRLAALCDVDGDRAATVARNAQIQCKCSSDYRSVLGEVDAILNALPNHLHAPVTLEALQAGVHVLCEKPLAIHSADARACAQAAIEKKLVLAVGMNRRFQDNHRLLRAILDEHTLGDLQNYDWQVGGPYDWNAASTFYFSKEQAGGGALIDYGVHLLDSLMDWFGPVQNFQYEDDDWGGGIEANVRLNLQHVGPYGAVNGEVRISRTYTLANRLLVRGSKAVAELPLSVPEAVFLHRELHGQSVIDKLTFPAEPTLSSSSFYRQMDNFLRSIEGVERPVIDGFHAAAVLELIESCYAQRKRMPEPWSEADISGGITA